MEHTDFEQMKELPKRPLYGEEIDKHMKQIFKDRVEKVYYEGDKEISPLEIHVLEAPTSKDFHVLYTVGMSAEQMQMPEDISPELEELSRCELMALLPYEWKLEVPEDKVFDNRLWWPVRLLEFLGNFPKENDTWLGFGHVVPNSDNCSPYAENTELCGVMLSSLQQEISMMQTEDGTNIHFYTLVPLYEEEMLYKSYEGVEALILKLANITGYGMIIFPDRPNVCEENT